MPFSLELQPEELNSPPAPYLIITLLICQVGARNAMGVVPATFPRTTSCVYDCMYIFVPRVLYITAAHNGRKGTHEFVRVDMYIMRRGGDRGFIYCAAILDFFQGSPSEFISFFFEVTCIVFKILIMYWIWTIDYNLTIFKQTLLGIDGIIHNSMIKRNIQRIMIHCIVDYIPSPIFRFNSNTAMISYSRRRYIKTTNLLLLYNRGESDQSFINV